MTKVSAEILRAERSSLLVFDEDDNYLKAKAAFGVRSEIIKQQLATGERVANQVWNDGKTSLVKNVELSGLSPASLERDYKSNSFISFPIFVGTRKIGVLNVTDKTGGEDYDENDVRLLESIAPSLAIALDRALLQQKAGKFEVLSITDALTGLLNRRYLEERLAEELKRSHRHGYPMSFMMIDVDNFKKYNDLYGHVAGDEALQITARCLKGALRGADVAARFGGEEFSILLPQTTLSEANLIAERIRRKVETTTFAHGRVTVSIGIAPFSQRFDTPQAFIKAADTALYEAKNNGKNLVRLWKNAESGSTINSF
ncbi:MAG: sensor domain-containing diguanylate cyclase [Pyrinomonadaceae bacterium]|nr:sensor domain-containing diguanylate cyclase [Pyrinomonadaceae bacterium]